MKNESFQNKCALALLFLFIASMVNAQTFTQLAVSGVVSGVSGYADGVREAVKFHYPAFKKEHPGVNDGYWNLNESWTNKYKNGDPAQGSKYFGSTTFLVGLTDGYHTMGTVRNITGAVAVIALYWETEKDWWTYTPWIRTKWDKPGKKPILAYPAEAALLFGCNRIGFTLAYDIKYNGK